MRIELTFPDQSQETADLKSGTGTSSVTSPFVISAIILETSLDGNINLEEMTSEER
jgi:hypothetical protein